MSRYISERAQYALNRPSKVDAALGRYFDAFEDGSLTAAVCKRRVDELVARRAANAHD